MAGFAADLRFVPADLADDRPAPRLDAPLAIVAFFAPPFLAVAFLAVAFLAVPFLAVLRFIVLFAPALVAPRFAVDFFAVALFAPFAAGLADADFLVALFAPDFFAMDGIRLSRPGGVNPAAPPMAWSGIGSVPDRRRTTSGAAPNGGAATLRRTARAIECGDRRAAGDETAPRGARPDTDGAAMARIRRRR